MKYIACFLCLICVTSCDYFSKQKVSSQDIVNEELQTFNWKEVDAYPSFESCNHADSKPERKQCFSSTLSTYFTAQLSKYTIVVVETLQDTVHLKFQISEIGEIRILDIERSEKTINAIPNIDSLLLDSLDGLPKIFPAIKRGQQVKTEFTLPIIIEVN